MGETRETKTVSYISEDADSGRELQDTPHNSHGRRRNGMWNIFDGVDPEQLRKLSGLSQEIMLQLVSEDEDSLSQCLSLLASDLTETSSSPSPSAKTDCPCERSRIQRSFSATVGEEMQTALQNRQRRNAVGNLFEVLTPSQKLLLVEHLQQQLERLQEGSGDSGKIILTLSDLSSATTATSPTSSAVSSPRSQGEIVCG